MIKFVHQNRPIIGQEIEGLPGVFTITADDIMTLNRRLAEIVEANERETSPDITTPGFIDTIAVGHASGNSGMAVGNLKIVDDTRLEGFTTVVNDSSGAAIGSYIRWDDRNSVFGLFEVPVVIRKGEGDWAEISIVPYNDQPPSIHADITLEAKNFEMVLHAISKPADDEEQAKEIPASIMVEVLNFEFHAGKLVGYVTSVTASNASDTYSISIST